MTKKNTNFPDIHGLRLLFLATYPPPFGGIATHLKILIPTLLKEGVSDIAIISFSGKNSIENVDGATVYRYNLKSNIWQLLLPKNIILIWNVLKSFMGMGLSASTLVQESIKAILTNNVASLHRSSVVNFYMANASLHLIPLNKYWGGNKGIILTVFGEVYDSAEFIFKNKSLIIKLLSIPKYVLATSRHCADSFKKIGNIRDIEVVFYGVELDGVTSKEKRKFFRDSHELTAKEVLIFFMGRMMSDMGLDVVLQSAPDLIKLEPRARIIIAGATGHLTKEAYGLAKKFPGKILIFENVSFSDQSFLYSAADILVAPSFNQRACMGVSIKEAMAARLPVIAGAGGGISEAVIDGETGFLIPLGLSGQVDGGDYLRATQKLIADPVLRLRFGNAGRKRAEEIFSVAQTNRRMAHIMLEANPIPTKNY